MTFQQPLSFSFNSSVASLDAAELALPNEHRLSAVYRKPLSKVQLPHHLLMFVGYASIFLQSDGQVDKQVGWKVKGFVEGSVVCMKDM